MSYEVSGESKGNEKNLPVKDKDKCTEEKDDKNAIIAGLQQLREQQRNIVVELARVEDDKREHERVIQVLKKMEGDRKCFRMVGTTLVQHEIKTVLPILESTLQNLDTLVNSMKDNLIEKGKELQEYTEKHKIRYVTEKELREESERNMKK
ncbi:KE2 family protein [Brugia malayi]|uniref:KE2 family protein n=1 Tax=Brugia malayi TaxID=6279 RepID=A0A4E9G2Y5_BRUMA|nr:KE2 family protein [Brugia malayi]VIO99799.1 KE2 family protein [Brugia malayi]